jgi:hypothetical protein
MTVDPEVSIESDKVRNGVTDKALAWVVSVITCYDQMLSTLRGKIQEAILGPVVIPHGDAFEQLPRTVTHRLLPQHVQQPLVRLPKRLVDRFSRAATKMGGNALLALLELSLMKEALRACRGSRGSTSRLRTP